MNQATDHRERAERMWGCGFNADDLAQMLADKKADKAELERLQAIVGELPVTADREINMDMTNASDEDQLAQEGFVNTRDCPGCELLRSEIAHLQAIVDKTQDGVPVVPCPVCGVFYTNQKENK